MIRRPAKETLHPRNRFREGYDFERLIKSSPALKNFVRLDAYRDLSIDYAIWLKVRSGAESLPGRS